MSTQAGRPGYESGVPAPERRAFFDLQRRITAIEKAVGIGGEGGLATPLDEVFIGPTAPPIPENYELWYDSDAPTIPLLSYVGSTEVASVTYDVTAGVWKTLRTMTVPIKRSRLYLLMAGVRAISGGDAGLAASYLVSTPALSGVIDSYVMLGSGFAGASTFFRVIAGTALTAADGNVVFTYSVNLPSTGKIIYLPNMVIFDVGV